MAARAATVRAADLHGRGHGGQPIGDNGCKQLGILSRASGQLASEALPLCSSSVPNDRLIIEQLLGADGGEIDPWRLDWHGQ